MFGKDIYLSLRQLNGSLKRLFETCEIEQEQADLAPPHAVAHFIDNLLSSGLADKQVQQLDRQLQSALQQVSDKRIEQWSSGITMAELEKTVERQKESLQSLEQEVAALKEGAATAAGEKKQLMDLIHGLIAVRDGLDTKRELLADQGDQPGLSMKIVDQLSKETANALHRIGVVVMDQPGAFDASMHKVVHTEQAAMPDQKDTVAITVRPGYSISGQLIRYQEISLYV